MKHYIDFFDEKEVWHTCQSLPHETLSPIYIAVSGNTGVGKSYLVNILTEHLRKEFGQRVVAVNERNFHHPLLKKMFDNPRDFAFGVQLNFSLQRYLCLKNLLMNGFIVIVERSHFDDSLFLEYHYENENITPEEHTLYDQFSKYVRTELPAPNIWLLLETSPNISRKRIDSAEAKGERPKEFPNDCIKQDYIDCWHKKYSEFFLYIKSQSSENGLFKESVIHNMESSTFPDDNYLGIAKKIIASIIE